MASFSSHIFKPYDIRGVYPGELNEETAYFLGRSFGIFVKDILGKEKAKITVGHDPRLSSPELNRSLVSGLLEEGVDVVDIGLASSPMHLFGIVHLRADAGIMITASHNPREYNGFKFTLQNGESVGEESGLMKIRSLFEGLYGSPRLRERKGALTSADIISEYVDFLIKDKKVDSSLKLVADSGNGAVGVILPFFSERLKLSSVPLFWEPDGNFPNRSPDPTDPEATQFAKEAVRTEGADLGVVFDADGDRVVFVDEKGEEINPNHVTALLAEYFLEKYPGEKIWYDAVSSGVVPETIKGAGGIPVLGRVGRVRAKAAMKEENCIFGGEHSAHYYFRDYFFSDSALLALIFVLEILSQRKENLSMLVKKYARYAQSGELNFKVKDKSALLREIEEEYSGGKTSHVDGVSVEYGDWWFNVRASNTEPLIRLNVEAIREDILRREQQKLENFIGRYQ